MRAVTLHTRQGVPFVVDADDCEAVGYYFWRLDASTGYITTTSGRWGSRRRSLTLHQFLLGPAPAGLQWDHINRIKTDNRRSNLRAVTASENTRNVGLRSDNKSGVRGVSWHKAAGCWALEVRLAPGGVRFRKLFKSLAEAARAREVVEREHWR